jgi:Tfp pilus assembly protein PilF
MGVTVRTRLLRLQPDPENTNIRMSPGDIAMRRILASLVLMLLTCASGLADDLKICMGEEKGDRIATCTRLVDAATTPADRSVLLAHRGVAIMPTQPARALADFNEGIKINPKCADCYAGRGAYYLLALKEIELARRDIRQALVLQPDNGFALHMESVLKKLP